jgi:hypothetical protein
VFALPAEGDDAPTYQCAVSFNTTGIVAALGLDGNPMKRLLLFITLDIVLDDRPQADILNIFTSTAVEERG